MAYSSIREFDPKVIGQIILNEKLMTANSVQDLIQTPEFNVLKVIGENDGLDNDEITSKYEPPYSVSMILSNLSADGLIVQNSKYKWLLSDKFIELIKSKKGKIVVTSEKSNPKKDEALGQNLAPQIKKKQDFKKFADVLNNLSFIPKFYTYIEDLYGIPELQLLIIIRDNQPISTADLEDLFTHPEASVPLTLSNLKADGVIEETKQYLWKISDNIESKLKDYETKFDVSNLNVKEVEIIREDDPLAQVNLVEHMQLIKTLLDMNYFKNQTVNESLRTPEFKLLSLINSRSPISQEEIEEMINVDISISMLLSNLKIDSLIEQLNDYSWQLSEDFRQQIARVKISKEDFLRELKTRDQVTEPNKATPSTKPQKEKKAQESAKDVMRDILSHPETKGTDPIVAALTKYKYLSDTNLTLSELHTIPEYEILSQLKNNNILSSEEIEDLTKVSSLSMYLSNLRADNLVDQTNDYRWTLGSEFGEVTEQVSSSKKAVTKSKFTENKASVSIDKEKEDQAIFLILTKKGYLNPNNVSINDLNKIPEYEVIKILIENQKIDITQLKTKITSISPVHVSRLVSKLDADNVIKVQNETLTFTENFIELLKQQDKLIIENETERQLHEEQEKLRLEKEKERKALEEQERIKVEKEKERQLLEEQEKLRVQEEKERQALEEQERLRKENERQRQLLEQQEKLRLEKERQLLEEQEKIRVAKERQLLEEQEKLRMENERQRQLLEEQEKLRMENERQRQLLEQQQKLRIENERQLIEEQEKLKIEKERQRQLLEEQEKLRIEKEKQEQVLAQQEKIKSKYNIEEDRWIKLKLILKEIDYIDLESVESDKSADIPELEVLNLLLKNGKMDGEAIRKSMKDLDPVKVTKTLNKLQFDAVIDKNMGIYSISQMILDKIEELMK